MQQILRAMAWERGFNHRSRHSVSVVGQWKTSQENHRQRPLSVGKRPEKWISSKSTVSPQVLCFIAMLSLHVLLPAVADISTFIMSSSRSLLLGHVKPGEKQSVLLCYRSQRRTCIGMRVRLMSLESVCYCVHCLSSLEQQQPIHSSLVPSVVFPISLTYAPFSFAPFRLLLARLPCDGRDKGQKDGAPSGRPYLLHVLCCAVCQRVTRMQSFVFYSYSPLLFLVDSVVGEGKKRKKRESETVFS